MTTPQSEQGAVNGDRNPPTMTTTKPPLAPSPSLDPTVVPPPPELPALAPSLRNAAAPKGHTRNVSWGDPSRQLQQPALGDITQKDMGDTETEAYLLNSLENRDPTTSAPQSQKSVFSNVTDEDFQAMKVNDNSSVASGGAGSKSANSSVFSKRPNRHTRKETIGDKLQGLTAAMDAVHLEHLAFLDDENAQDLLPQNVMEKASGHSSGEDFQRNTNQLLQRHSRRPTPEDVETGGTAAYATSTPAEITGIAAKAKSADQRWNMLKHAMAATDMTKAKDEKVGMEVPVTTTSTDKKEAEDGPPPTSSQNIQEKKKSRKWRANKAEKILRELQDVLTPRRSASYSLFKIGIFFVMLPSAGVAFILFYLAGNPPTGIVDLERYRETGEYYNTDGEPINENTASASWWLLFMGVRQVTLLLTAKFLEIFFIDYLSVRSKFSVRVLGPWATLFILQTKGWPFMLFAWGMLSLALMTGTKPFSHHWGYGQDYIDIFNESNPSGEVVDSSQYHRITAVAVAVGVIVSCKRFWLGLHLGRQTFAQFSSRLESVMKRILLVSEVASLGRAFERYVNAHKGESRRNVSVTHYGVQKDRLRGMITENPEEISPGFHEEDIDTSTEKYVIDPEDRHPMTGQLSEAQKGRILSLLGQWAEPTLAEKEETTPTVNEILQFRQALQYLKTPYPFSGSFGLADRRETTIESSQEVYRRLLLRSPDPEMLTFEVIAVLGINKHGEMDAEKLKDLIKLLKPDRDGSMHCVDFVKSVDEVYKELRLLRASVASSSKIDRAFESIFNIIFYIILGSLILSQVGYDPLALFLSVSGVVLAFAFMISSASSKYFEGLLFILLRRPYQVGDGIAIAGVNESTISTGSPMWIVEDVDLFTTKLVFSFTGEKATVSNGALANSRVINASISKEASLFVLIKFPVDVSYDKLQLFREQLATYFKNRPREWIAFTRFRSTRFEIDQGFVEYIICGQHRLGWSKFGDLQQSRADLMHFCMELQKRMDLVYKQPTQPVDVNLRNGGTLPDVSGVPPSPLTAPASPGGSVVSQFASLQGMFAPKSE